MPCGWEGNRRSRVALAMRHRLQWFIHLRRAPGLGREMSTPPTLSCGVWHILPYPENDDRILTIDSVTSLRPVCVDESCSIGLRTTARSHIARSTVSSSSIPMTTLTWYTHSLICCDFSPDMELNHWVTGSMGHLGHLSRPGHRVIILIRCETRVFPVFEKMP